MPQNLAYKDENFKYLTEKVEESGHRDIADRPSSAPQIGKDQSNLVART